MPPLQQPFFVPKTRHSQGMDGRHVTCPLAVYVGIGCCSEWPNVLPVRGFHFAQDRDFSNYILIPGSPCNSLFITSPPDLGNRANAYSNRNCHRFPDCHGDNYDTSNTGTNTAPSDADPHNYPHNNCAHPHAIADGDISTDSAAIANPDTNNCAGLAPGAGSNSHCTPDNQPARSHPSRPCGTEICYRLRRVDASGHRGRRE